jgi:hypothetical protein
MVDYAKHERCREVRRRLLRDAVVDQIEATIAAGGTEADGWAIAWAVCVWEVDAVFRLFEGLRAEYAARYPELRVPS